jgi:hypothetical protein
MAIRTIYEISKPEVNFYAVERSGFTTVGEVINSVVNDMLQLGAFSVSNLIITTSSASGNVTMPAEWPPAERILTVTNGGAGYKVGDLLKIGNVNTTIGTTANIRVASIGANGAVTSVTIANVGPYYGNPVGAAKETSFINSTYTTGYLTTLGNVTSSVGVAPNIIAANIQMIPQTQQVGQAPQGFLAPPLQWDQDNGANGAYTKYPRTGFWANILYSDAVSGNANVYIGQTVYLANAGGSSNPESIIPEGTTITSMSPIEVVTGIREVTPLTRKPFSLNNTQTIFYGPYIEITQQYTWFTVSNPVTVRIGDNIALRGGGLTISDTTTKLPAGFKVILEAGASVDPLNDPVGVYGAVNASTSNSKYVVIKNLTTQNAFNPVIYAGQTVTSTLQNGSIDGYVTVVSVTSTGATTANVELSSNQTLPANEPLHFVFSEQQPWRVAFDVVRNLTKPDAGPQQLLAYAATPVQLQDNGSIANIWSANGISIIDRSGMMGAFPTGVSGAPLTTNPTEGFLNRETRVQSNPEVYPLNYAMTLTDRGMFFGVWEGTWSTIQKSKAKSTTDKDNYFNWFLIQRPVNRYTGKVLTVGRTPVFCINSVGYKYWKFIVREEDVLHPSLGDPDNRREYIAANSVVVSESCSYRVPADAHTQDSFAVLNTTNQIALTEDSKYLVSFLHNLTTPRFRYSEELDMIGQTSADVCMAGNDVSITAYGESGPRQYRALPANNPYNSGLRICVLKNIPI